MGALVGAAVVYSASHTFTPSSMNSSFGHMEQLDTTATSNFGDNVWTCDNNEWNEYCMYLEVYNIGCEGVETIGITLSGASVSGALDLYSILSFDNEFVAILNDWDGNGNAGPSISGLADGSLVASGYSLQSAANGDMFTMLEDSHSLDEVFATLFGGDVVNNRRILSEKAISFGASPVSLIFTNDVVNNKLDVDFEIDLSYFDINGSVTFDETSFDALASPNENYRVFFMPSQNTAYFSEFEVHVTCEVDDVTPEGRAENLIVENKPGVSSYWYAMSLLNLSDDYEPSDLHVYIANEDNSEWFLGTMYYWGEDAVWQFTPLADWQLPFDVKIVNSANNHETIVAYDAITSFGYDDTFDLQANF